MFATAINCMDGRTQVPVNQWAQGHFDVRYVDVITEPGPIRVLADGATEVAESIYRRVAISVERHGSKGIAVVAHHDCAGNPLDKVGQIEQLQTAVERTAARFPGVAVVGLWVDEQWQVQPVLTRCRPSE